MKRIILLFTLFSIYFSSCKSLRKMKSLDDYKASSQDEYTQNQIEGSYSLSILFGEPYVDINASLKIFSEESTLSSTI